MAFYQIVIWCALIFFINGLLNVLAEWAGKFQSFKDNSIFHYGLMFIFAAIFATIALLIRSAILEVETQISWQIVFAVLLLMITSTIGLPSTFIATRSALGASRNQFVDYSTTPLFTLIVGHLFDSPASELFLFSLRYCWMPFRVRTFAFFIIRCRN